MKNARHTVEKAQKELQRGKLCVESSDKNIAQPSAATRES
jgi:hypothetical protein